MPIKISDPSDSRVDLYRNLRDRTLRNNTELSNGVFVAEGRFVIERLRQSAHRIISVLVLEHHLQWIGALMATVEVPVFVASPEVMNMIAGFDVHRGALALGVRPPSPTVDDLARQARRLLVAENVTDTENLGTMIRSASALGFDAVITDEATADPFYRRVVRVSMGESMMMPVARVPAIGPVVTSLNEMGWQTVALTPAGETSLVDVPVNERCALIVGAEGPGLPPHTINSARYAVRIDMHHNVDSLNVAVAASIAMFAITNRFGG